MECYNTMKEYAIGLLIGCRACFVLCIVSQICGCASDRQKLVPFSEIWISGGAISELNAQLDRAVFAAGAIIDSMPEDSYFGVYNSSTNRPTISKNDYIIQFAKNSREEIYCSFECGYPMFLFGYPFSFVYITTNEAPDSVQSIRKVNTSLAK